MPRYRSIRGEERADDPVFAQASWGAIFFYDQLMCYVDDKGRKKFYPMAIAGELFPRREDISPKQIKEWVEEWVSLGRIKLYEVDGIPYLWMCNMLNEQNIVNPGRSKLPPHPEDPEAGQPALFEPDPDPDLDPIEGVNSVSIDPKESVNRGDLESIEGVKVGRTQAYTRRSSGVKELNSNSPPSPPPDWFEGWWEEFDRTYPSRGGGTEQRPQAKGLLLSMTSLGEAHFAEILEGAKRFRAWGDAKGKTGTDEGIPTMLNWVKGERWREPYVIQNGKPKAEPKPEERGPKQGRDFHIGTWRVPVDANGEQCDEDSFGFVKYVDRPGPCWIRGGVPTDEPWTREAWEQEQAKEAA